MRTKIQRLSTVFIWHLLYNADFGIYAVLPYNFMQWTLRRNAGHIHFTDEQMEWLRLIKDHIAVSLSIEPEDLDLSPFDRKGGLGRFYDVFGDQYEAILQEMNVELVA